MYCASEKNQDLERAQSPRDDGEGQEVDRTGERSGTTPQVCRSIQFSSEENRVRAKNIRN